MKAKYSGGPHFWHHDNSKKSNLPPKYDKRQQMLCEKNQRLRKGEGNIPRNQNFHWEQPVHPAQEQELRRNPAPVVEAEFNDESSNRPDKGGFWGSWFDCGRNTGSHHSSSSSSSSSESESYWTRYF